MQEWLRSLQSTEVIEHNRKMLVNDPRSRAKINAVRYTAGRKMNSHYNSERAVYKQWFVAVLLREGRRTWKKARK